MILPPIARAFQDFSNDICRHLTEGWQITMRFENGSADVELVNEIGDEYPIDGDLVFEERCMLAVNVARHVSGWNKIIWTAGREKHGVRCPYCGSANLDFERLEFFREWWCNECERRGIVII